MDETTREILWHQFGAAIDMLENAMLDCSQTIWSNGSGAHDFWYMAYHTLFFLDYDLSDTPSEADFQPPEPFTKSEFDPEGVLPERIYSKPELLEYLQFAREKCRTVIRDLTPEKAQSRFISEYRNFSRLELLLYSMRHVQHHAAQLNLLLRQGQDAAPRWVGQTKHKLHH